MSSTTPTTNSDASENSDEDNISSGEEMMRALVQHHKHLMEIVKAQIDRRQRKRRYLDRNREIGHTQLVNDYFSTQPLYPDNIFRRRFRMRRNLFLRLVTALGNHSRYFQMRFDATKRRGLSPLQKCTAAISQLAYGDPADHLDEYLRMGETTDIDCMFYFCRCVVELFGGQYLRRPNADDTQRLLQMHEQRHGFPGMLGSLDCMHWEWKNCPVAWQNQFTRGHAKPTIVLEAVASADLWIWHAFFGVAGSRNDLNVLYESPLFNNVFEGTAPPIDFEVNDTHYTKGYYLTDGIYQNLATFVKSFSCPTDAKRKKFKERQEAARKDVERAFEVLQSRWAIIKGPARFWYRDNLKEIMLTCIILHNMIVEDEGDHVTNWADDTGDSSTQANHGSTQAFQEYLQRNNELRDSNRPHELRADLVEHIWARYGDN